jgi:hypothetical protein
MGQLLELLAYFDLIDPIEGLLSTFRYADWQAAYQRRGIYGLCDEFFASILARNCSTIWVLRRTDWSGAQIETLLMRHGVRIWGRGFRGNRIFFRVKKRQVRWAEYLLLRAGVIITSAIVDPRNLRYAESYLPGSEPPIRKPRPRFTADRINHLLNLFR